LHRPARAQPSGDTPTRSALLDCLASGLAVPAVFDPALAAMLPFADVLNYTALLAQVPLDESSEGSAALNILAGVGLEERAAKLAAVEHVAHVRRRACLPCPFHGVQIRGVVEQVPVCCRAKCPANVPPIEVPSCVVGVLQRNFLAVDNLMTILLFHLETLAGNEVAWRAWPAPALKRSVGAQRHGPCGAGFLLCGAPAAPAGAPGPAVDGAPDGRRANDVAQGCAAARLRQGGAPPLPPGPARHGRRGSLVTLVLRVTAYFPG